MARPAKISRMEALRLGLTRYYTGKLCRHGHRAERRALAGNCVVCTRKAAKKWKKKNPERVREMQRAASARHRAKWRRYRRLGLHLAARLAARTGT